jgi:[ribosomal protein S5]-alanine N-acetyltransferase
MCGRQTACYAPRAMQIETKRLRLREFVEADWQAVLSYQRKAEYGASYEAQERDETSVREFVSWFIRWQTETPRRRYQLALILKDGGQLIGNCGLRIGSIEQLDMQPAASEAVVGYELDPAFWRKGYATEAAAALLEFGFAELRLHRVWSYCVAENERSAAVLRRLGMMLEGRLRENELMRGRWVDTSIYGILAAEWRALPR